ncbi:hypothetical protein HJC23_013717 [Cyclotella cryptica]|uniref:Reverse transcriptase domain-containing protein n=1 Tax=Cyclotella cryptica TaxID=29204 RepID=A0ABD3QUX2_9STRA
MKFTWDGRASFYPKVGYERDVEFMARFKAYLDEEHIPFDPSSENSSDNESQSDSDDSTSEVGISPKVANNPPLYDRIDHYHPMSNVDRQILLLGACLTTHSGEMMQNMLPRRLRNYKTASEEIVEHAFLNILCNRKENKVVKKTLRSNILLEARIAGLSGSPSRTILVPGTFPLLLCMIVCYVRYLDGHEDIMITAFAFLPLLTKTDHHKTLSMISFLGQTLKDHHGCFAMASMKL